jgi:CMP-N-acetylneuraminic acid synthetase
MRKYNLRNIFHLEIDNLVYFKVEELLEKCKCINKILITSDSERRYIAGTCFINNPDSLSVLNKFFTENCIVLANGRFENTIFYVMRVIHPPMHKNKSLKYAINEQDYF